MTEPPDEAAFHELVAALSAEKNATTLLSRLLKIVRASNSGSTDGFDGVFDIPVVGSIEETEVGDPVAIIGRTPGGTGVGIVLYRNMP